MKNELAKILELIATDFPTEEERDFWTRFTKYHFYTDESIPLQIVWFDLNYRTVYANLATRGSLGIPADILIGKNLYENYPPNITIPLRSTGEYVSETKQRFVGEHIVTNYITGEVQYYECSVDPLFHHQTGNLMGFFMVSTDITAKKNLKLIQDEYEDLAQQLVGDMHELMNKYRVTMLYNKIGDDIPIDNYKNLIHLTKREQDILFLLSHHKNAKEIAQVLSKIDNKEVSHFTVHAIIGKNLYTKFNVLTTSELMEKANLYGLIPIAI